MNAENRVVIVARTDTMNVVLCVAWKCSPSGFVRLATA